MLFLHLLFCRILLDGHHSCIGYRSTCSGSKPAHLQKQSGKPAWSAVQRRHHAMLLLLLHGHVPMGQLLHAVALITRPLLPHAPCIGGLGGAIWVRLEGGPSVWFEHGLLLPWLSCRLGCVAIQQRDL